MSSCPHLLAERWHDVSEMDACPLCQKTEIDRLRAEVLRLKERLEIGYCFDSEGNRVECEDDGYDGIFCRDQTIKIQDETVDRLRAENDALRKQLMNNSPSTTSDSGK